MQKSSASEDLTMPQKGPCLKYNVLLLFAWVSFLSVNCRKEKTHTDIDGVTGFTWRVYTVQEASDTYINPIPTDWQFQLNNDQSFSFSLSGSACKGTYSWTTLDTASATVMFTIKEWSN